MRGDGTAAAIEAPRRHIIERPRLTRLLDEADARILMLVAPAGYGKTTLARQWVDAGGRRALWITGSHASADAASIALRLRDLLRPTYPRIGRHLEDRLRVTPGSIREAAGLGAYLGEEIDEWDPSRWLVLDDYQFLMASRPADALVAALLENCSLQTIIGSRQRPKWATARKLIYGEIHELGRSALAMDSDEAGEVLRGWRRQETNGLLALADGWPAIIGLAADARAPDVPGERVPASLYDFFAQELYQVASPEAQVGLTALAHAPMIDVDVARTLLGDAAVEVVDEGKRLGLLQESSAPQIIMHSLIRDFLLRRRNQLPLDSEAIISRLVDYFAGRGSFDHLFDLARTFPESPTLSSATNSALEELLLSQRQESLAPWLDHARSVGVDTAAVDLAAAEVAFREAKYDNAEILAKRGAERFEPESPLRAMCWFRAGASAYQASKPTAALEYHGLAASTAVRDEDRLQGVWGLLTATLELERDPSPYVAEIERAASTSLVYRMRLATARLSHAYRTGAALSGPIDEAAAVSSLLDQINDPMVTSAFLNTYALVLSIAAEYEAALAAVADEIRIIEEHGLRFAVPHAVMWRAIAMMGRRSFTDAHRDLEASASLARPHGDQFILANVAVNEIRMLLCQGAPQEAAARAARCLIPAELGPLRAELLGVHALAAAASGDAAHAEDLIAEAEPLSTSIESRGYTEWARMIVRIITAVPNTEDLLAGALEAAFEKRCLHPFVCAYRAFPPLLQQATQVEPIRVLALIQRARDETLGRAAGLDLPRTAKGPLSPRETEVLTLLSEGLSNREIGQRLFISEVTAKVHVRRIFDKLGVRTRTEAALLAAGHLANGD